MITKNFICHIFTKTNSVTVEVVLLLCFRVVCSLIFWFTSSVIYYKHYSVLCAVVISPPDLSLSNL